MKKLTLLLGALMIAGFTFAHDGGKCCKKEKCSKECMKHCKKEKKDCYKGCDKDNKTDKKA
mgnify:CR=1 FL=1